jgi:hypothetical protein
MSSGFLVWRPGTMQDGICKLNGLSGVDDDFEIDDGVSRIQGWPSDAAAAMDPDFPKDIGLADSLYGASFLVVSSKAKAFLDGENIGKVEFLPMKIINHKGRVASGDYFVVNPLQIIDCIDQAASVVELDSIDKGMISTCDKLVLRESVIPRELKVFRAAFWSGLILIRRETAGRIEAAGLTGMSFIEPDEYTGLF